MEAAGNFVRTLTLIRATIAVPEEQASALLEKDLNA